MDALSPFEDEDRPLRHEAQFLIAELREPGLSDEGAIERTLTNYPYLTRDEISSWWRVAEFRRGVKESRERAAEYAAEDARRGRSPHTTESDPYAIDPDYAFSSPAGEKSRRSIFGWHW